MRRTKIIATIGPATRDEDSLRSLLEAGVDMVRLNFSHTGHAEAREKFAKAVGRDPQSSRTYYNWGSALATQRGHAEACEKFAKAAEIDPQFFGVTQHGLWASAGIEQKGLAIRLHKSGVAPLSDPF